MCFSAEASFGASAVLLGIGAVTVRKARSTPQYFLAAIPILFSLQQCSEGILWYALSHPASGQLRDAAMYTFLVFAQAVWPVLIPLCVLLAERQPVRRKIQSVLLGIGALFAIYFSYCLFTYPVNAVADHHHIRYEFGFSLPGQWFYGLIYFLPTILAPFLSGMKLMRLLGAVNLVSYGIARLFYNGYVISVWCFLATVISLVALLIVIRQNRVVPADTDTSFPESKNR